MRNERARATKKTDADRKAHVRATSVQTAPLARADRRAETRDMQTAVSDPSSASPQAILQLQRTYGNRAVQRLLAQSSVQAKLTVGAAHDRYEDEADRVADQVMRTSAPAGAIQRAA